MAQGPPGPGALHPLRCCRPSCPLCAQSQAVRPSSSPGPAPPPPGQQAAAALQCPELPQQQWSHPQKQSSRGTERGGGRATGTPHPIRARSPIPQHGVPGLAGAVGQGSWGNWVCRGTRRGKGLSLGEKRDASPLTRAQSPGPESNGASREAADGGGGGVCWFQMARAQQCPERGRGVSSPTPPRPASE